jgi:chemotaxis protein MotA
MKILLGLTIFSFGFYNAILHLNQDIHNYWDMVAFLVVVGGTLAAAIITLPNVRFRFLIYHLLGSMFVSFYKKRQKAVLDGLNLIKGTTPDLNFYKFNERILYEGGELLKLGFSREKIEEILTDRIEQFAIDSHKVANWLRSLAKYPPAFGLSGTVLGLVYLMRGISQGTTPAETGTRMAIALVATFYGILLANVLINPLGERIKENIDETVTLCEISLKAILLMRDRTNILIAQETLNSFISSNSKVDILGQYLEAS